MAEIKDRAAFLFTLGKWRAFHACKNSLLTLLVEALLVTKSEARTSFMPNDFDLFFTSVSSFTVSSMSTMEMEVFSNTQLVIITILMLLGGEIFTSLLGLLITKFKLSKFHNNKVVVKLINSSSSNHQIELSVVTLSELEPNIHNAPLKPNYKSIIKCLTYVVLGYLLLVHVGFSSLISTYIILVPNARKVLKHKGIEVQTFAIFTTVSTFANCGFVPTNENMIVFKNNSGLLILLVLLILSGNTLFPVILRCTIWCLERITRRVEFSYMLENCNNELGYGHLMSSMRCVLLLVTFLGFIVIQMILFCAMEWKSEGMEGMSGYHKFVGALFQTVNSRHAGESVVDLSIVSPAVLLLFVLMMYLPPYTTFDPAIGARQESGDNSEKDDEVGINPPKTTLVESLIFSQLSYLTIFVILICIFERQKMKEDPLNFNVLNVVTEVISEHMGMLGFQLGTVANED